MISLNENGTLNYVSSGLFKSDCVWSHPRRIIDTYEIIFMYEGTAYICENNTEYTLKQNDILFLEPGKEHYGFQISEDYVSFSWLHFETTYKKYQSLPKHFHASNPAMLKTLFSQCMHIVNTNGYDPICADLYTALYIEEMLSDGKNAFSSQNRLAPQIKEYVTLNIEKSLSIQHISEYFGYNESYISKIFKETYGILLSKYILTQRLTYAKSLLNTTFYTVNQISQILSFKSENHFIKFFKYHTHLTPSEYRSLHTNIHINNS